MSQTVVWCLPVVSNALTRTLVHFFPSAGGVTAPYAAHCKLTLFGAFGPDLSILIDGARLSQPDGVRLDDVFPVLADGTVRGLCGLELELGTPQPRIDMNASQVVVEYVTAENGVRFVPNLLRDGRSFRPLAVFHQDAGLTTSFLVVNPSDAVYQFSFATPAVGTNAATRLWDGRIDRRSTVELVTPDNLQQLSVRGENSVGSYRSLRGYFDLQTVPGTAGPRGGIPEVQLKMPVVYEVWRDATSRRLVAVHRLERELPAGLAVTFDGPVGKSDGLGIGQAA